MLKKSKKPGKSISAKAEIQNISNHGIWVLVNEQDLFMSFDDFPWFLKARLNEIYNLKLFHGHHLHWPDLDIDIDIETLKHLESYPLKYS
ncbi:DUF2442 domain-containing protein [soil metagenome]